MKPTTKVRIFYWVGLLFFGWIIYNTDDVLELLKWVTVGVAIILVEIFTRREWKQATKEEKLIEE
ncbi:MAG: hypothetical protein NT155_03820 [Candidatus Staskawiczbacteria bacterium]|nr:hypothetical protein [Candidatus Staskawiczbacteria bacterium]